jgi:hypothetical protein
MGYTTRYNLTTRHVHTARTNHKQKGLDGRSHSQRSSAGCDATADRHPLYKHSLRKLGEMGFSLRVASPH